MTTNVLSQNWVWPTFSIRSTGMIFLVLQEKTDLCHAALSGNCRANSSLSRAVWSAKPHSQTPEHIPAQQQIQFIARIGGRSNTLCPLTPWDCSGAGLTAQDWDQNLNSYSMTVLAQAVAWLGLFPQGSFILSVGNEPMEHVESMTSCHSSRASTWLFPKSDPLLL